MLVEAYGTGSLRATDDVCLDELGDSAGWVACFSRWVIGSRCARVVRYYLYGCPLDGGDGPQWCSDWAYSMLGDDMVAQVSGQRSAFGWFWIRHIRLQTYGSQFHHVVSKTRTALVTLFRARLLHALRSFHAWALHSRCMHPSDACRVVLEGF